VQELAKKFRKLFAGLPRAYGTYQVQKADAKGIKLKGKARTINGEVTTELWERHLEGKQRLGIVPIRDDGTIRFAAIDVDCYDVNLSELEEQCAEMGLPLVPCRSKSGGAHLYLFGSEDLEATGVRRHLMEWAAALGFPGSEVFPKQDALASTKDVGNWINMPFFDCARTTCYAVVAGHAVGANKFLEVAHKRAVTMPDIEGLQLPQRELLEEGPPCLQYLCRVGFPDGSRNNALFDLGVYARLRYGDHEWEPWVDRFNQQYMRPGTSTEVQNIVRSLRRKTYHYMCDQHPIANHCNKTLCRQRKYGIGSGTDGTEPNILIDYLVKIDSRPPTWYVGVDGKRVELTTDDLMVQDRFRKLCLEQINKIPDRITKKRWDDMVQQLCENIEIVDVPPDAGADGQFMFHLEQYCTGVVQARTKEDILSGKPWTDPDMARTYFRSSDLITYLRQQHFRDFTTRQIWDRLRLIGGHTQFQLNGKCTQCWWVPEFVRQNEDLPVPRVQPEEDF